MNADRTDRTDPSDAATKTLLPDIAGLYCLIIFTLLAFFGGGKMLNDHDTLMHIRAGEVMIEQGRLLTSDIFSHTAYGASWTAHEWLAEVIMGGLHLLAGLPGVVIFYCLLAALSFWLLFRLAREIGGDWPSFLVVSFALILAARHLLARPHIFTWLLGILTLFLLLRGRPRHLYALPLLTAFWANVHGAFAVGLFLQAVFLAGPVLDRWPGWRKSAWLALLAEKKHALIVLALSAAAVGLNPFGFALYLFPFQVSTPLFMTSINEWLGTNFQTHWPARFYLLFFFFLLLANREKIPWAERLLLLFWVNAALAHARHVSLAGILLVPFQVRLLASLASAWQERLSGLRARFLPSRGQELALSPWGGPVLTILLAVALFGVSALDVPAWQGQAAGRFALPEKFPRAAARYLKEQRPAGRMFNEHGLGGFLIYELADPRVFIDGRVDMYGEKIFADYLKIAAMREGAEERLDEYGIDWLIFSRQAALVRYLKATGRWTSVYEDEQVAILVRALRAARSDKGQVTRGKGQGTSDE